MAKLLLLILGASVLVGAGVALIWSPLVGLSIGIALGVVGTTGVVLRRNHKDLQELRAGQLPGAVERAPGDDEQP